MRSRRVRESEGQKIRRRNSAQNLVLLRCALAMVLLSTSAVCAQTPAPVPLSDLPSDPRAAHSGAARPTAPTIRASAAILVESRTGAVLFARNPDKRLPPASTTKMLTALLLARSAPPSLPMAASPAAAATPGSALGMKPGEPFTARDLLYAMLLVSANDACVAVAEQLAGTTPKFVDRMNAEAQRLGATNTHFTNPHGLNDPNHYSTARDLACIARAALRDPLFDAAARARTYLVPARGDRPQKPLTNKDDLLWTFPGADGIKTGWTQAAGYCFVGSATRNGRRLISVVLNSPNWQAETAALLQYGFACPLPAPSKTGSKTGGADVASPLSAPAQTDAPAYREGTPAQKDGDGTRLLPFAPAQTTQTSGDPDLFTQPSLSHPPLADPGQTMSELPSLLPAGSPSYASGEQSGGLPVWLAPQQRPGLSSSPQPALPGAPTLDPGSASGRSPQSPTDTIHAGETYGEQPGKSQAGTYVGNIPMSAWWPTRRSGAPPPASNGPFPLAGPSFWVWLLWLLILLVLLAACRRLWQVARARRSPVNASRFAWSLWHRPTRRRPQPSPTPAENAPAEADGPAFVLMPVPILRRSGHEWLERQLDDPHRLLESSVGRQARALIEIDPRSFTTKLLSLLGGASPKVRIALTDLLAPHAPRRAEETLLSLLEEEHTTADLRTEALQRLAYWSGDRHERLWMQTLMRDGSPAAAHALSALPCLDDTTAQVLRRFLTSPRAQEKDGESKTDLLAATIACVLGAHGLLPPDQAAPLLDRLPSKRRDPMVTATLRGISTEWAVARLVETVLQGHAAPALQALLDCDPGLIRAVLKPQRENLSPTAHTRATILEWLLLGEGDEETIKQLSEAGNDLASVALNLGRIHRWDPSQCPPDALLAAAQILSLRLGFSLHTPEQIAAIFRTVTDDETQVGPAPCPELETLARAYTHPAVYEAVQVGLHAEDGLSVLLTTLARTPNSPAYQEEIAFWCDKTPRETRLFLTQALSTCDSPTARAAVAARASDPCPRVRAIALRSLHRRPYHAAWDDAIEKESLAVADSEAATPAGRTLPEPAEPDGASLDAAA